MQTKAFPCTLSKCFKLSYFIFVPHSHFKPTILTQFTQNKLQITTILTRKPKQNSINPRIIQSRLNFLQRKPTPIATTIAVLEVFKRMVKKVNGKNRLNLYPKQDKTYKVSHSEQVFLGSLDKVLYKQGIR